jgi:hypothetical protein
MKNKFKRIIIGDWGDWRGMINKNNPVDHSNSNNIEMPCDRFNPVNCKDKLWKEWSLIGKIEK